MSLPSTPFRGNLSSKDISLLRDFMEIVKAGGLTAAEPRLNKSKAAISLGLSNLEQRLGMRLCERGRSGFSLTEQGSLIHTATAQLLADISRFSDFVGATSYQITGEISVMIDDSFAFEMEEPIAAAFAQMNRRFPQLRLQLRMTAPDQILSSVVDGSTDLGFTALLQPSDALVVVPLFEEKMGLFCGAAHPLFCLSENEITYESLQDYSFVRTDMSQDPDFARFLSGLSFLASAPTILSRIILIISSRYLGFVPLSFAQVWVEKGSIREIRVPNSRTNNTCSVIHRKSRPLSMTASIFKDILIKEVQQAVSV